MAIDSELDKFPGNPDDKQSFTDGDGNLWIYDQQTDSWEFCGPRLNVNLASPTNIGLLKPEFKFLLDTVAQFPGAFGIVVDKPYKQTVQGNVTFISNSLDISCLSPRGVQLGPGSGCGEETTVTCANEDVGEADITSLPRFEVKLNADYLAKLCIDLPAPKGPTGKIGLDGDKGADGFSDGPKGLTGDPGPNVTELLEFGQIIYEDLPAINDCPIVDIELVDRGRGPFFKVTRSCRTLAQNECALRLLVTPIVRTVTFNTDLTDENCTLSGLSDWTLNKISGDPLPTSPFLLRGSDDQTEECSTFVGVSLEQYVQGLIDLYEQKIVKLDSQWALLAKKHIEALDSKARTILSNLANELTRCESTLAGSEFGITFERCTPCSPASPASLSVAENGKIGSVQVSGKKWDVIS